MPARTGSRGLLGRFQRPTGPSQFSPGNRVFLGIKQHFQGVVDDDVKFLVADAGADGGVDQSLVIEGRPLHDRCFQRLDGIFMGGLMR